MGTFEARGSYGAKLKKRKDLNSGKRREKKSKKAFLSESSKKIYILSEHTKKEVVSVEEAMLAKDLLRFQSDFLFFQKGIGTFRKQYINQFIAIFNGKIVDSASSIDELKNKLQQKGIDTATSVVEFVSEEEHFMVL